MPLSLSVDVVKEFKRLIKMHEHIFPSV